MILCLRLSESKALLAEGTEDSLGGRSAAVSSACQQALKSLGRYSVAALLVAAICTCEACCLNMLSTGCCS